MNLEQLRKVYVKQATEAYRRKDGYDWQSALWCSRIVGKYDRGATLGLADDMGVSPDTVEDRAHAYSLFERLCNIYGGQFRLFVFMARRTPYVYLGHFRALYDLQVTYTLSDDQVLDLLQDILQNEGGLSTRKLDSHIRSRYGDSRDWAYYGQRVMKEINKTLQEPTVPDEGRKLLVDLYNWLGDNA